MLFKLAVSCASAPRSRGKAGAGCGGCSTKQRLQGQRWQWLAAGKMISHGPHKSSMVHTHTSTHAICPSGSRREEAATRLRTAPGPRGEGQVIHGLPRPARCALLCAVRMDRQQAQRHRLPRRCCRRLLRWSCLALDGGLAALRRQCRRRRRRCCRVILIPRLALLLAACREARRGWQTSQRREHRPGQDWAKALAPRRR